MKTGMTLGILALIMLPTIAGCCKPKTDSTSTSSTDPSSSPSSPSTAPSDSAAPSQSAAADAGSVRHTACAGNLTPVAAEGGRHACVELCANKKDCPSGLLCIGTAKMLNPDGTTGADERYCMAQPSGTCPSANMAPFWLSEGKHVCEVLCNAPGQDVCTPPMTCKGNGQLVKPDGTMGPAHRYCRK